MKANIYKCKISELAEKLEKTPRFPVGVTVIEEDPEVTVVEYRGYVFAFNEDLANKPYVYLVAEELFRVHSAYLSIEKAIDDFLTRKGWGGLQRPSVYIGVNINAGLYVTNNSDMWYIKLVPLND